MVLTQQGEWHRVTTVTALTDSIQCVLWKAQNMYTHTYTHESKLRVGRITPYRGIVQEMQKFIQIQG